jgi:hypothetical protein
METARGKEGSSLSKQSVIYHSVWVCTLGETRRSSGRDHCECTDRNCTWIDPTLYSWIKSFYNAGGGAGRGRTIVIVLLSVTRCAANRVTSNSRSIPFLLLEAPAVPPSKSKIKIEKKRRL